MNLQEELDKLKVHMSVDKATIQELNTFMAERREGNFVKINIQCRQFKIIQFLMFYFQLLRILPCSTYFSCFTPSYLISIFIFHEKIK